MWGVGPGDAELLAKEVEALHGRQRRGPRLMMERRERPEAAEAVIATKKGGSEAGRRPNMSIMPHLSIMVTLGWAKDTKP